MKRKQVFSVFLSVVMMLSLLTGCIYATDDVTVNADGSGSVEATIGFEKTFAEEQLQMTAEELAAMTLIQQNGYSYYVENEKAEFSCLRELNEILQSDSGALTFQMVHNADKTLTLNVTLDNSVDEEDFGETQDEGAFLPGVDMGDLGQTGNMDLDLAQLQQMMDSMLVRFTFKLPGKVRQLSAPIDGAAVDGSTVTLDFVAISTAMSEAGTEKAVLRFTTAAEDSAVRPMFSFTDVAPDAWYASSVNWVAANGGVNGYPDGTFRPSGTITAAQVAKIITNIRGVDTTPGKSDYWAAPAVMWCVEQGVLEDRGGYTAGVWDTPISRQEAVSAMVAGLGSELPRPEGADVPVIPDADAIAEQYYANVAAAYANGVVQGKDSAGNFFPDSSLTRAEVCRILDNLDSLTGLF